jgi:hypothetical protein
MDKPQHLRVGESVSGFAIFPHLRSASQDDLISVHESSRAGGPHVGIHVETRDGGSTGGLSVNVTLSATSAWRFAEQIMTAVANHYQGDSRPPLADRVADLKPGA